MIKEKYINNVKESSIVISGSAAESVRFKNNTKTSMRVYKDGFIGIAGAIGKYNEAELEKEASAALKQEIEYPCEPSTNRQEKVDKRTDFIKDEELVDEIKDLLYSLRKEHPDIIFSGQVNLTETNAAMLNDRNLKLEYGDKSISLGILFKHKDSPNSFDGFVGAQERNYNKALILDQANIMLNTINKRVELPQNKRYPVAFFGSDIPITRFLFNLEGSVLSSGTSPLSNKIGQKILSEDFTFCQSLNPEDVMNMPFFDAEGTVNSEYRYTFIENGVLKAPFTDKRTAQKYNLPLTGSAYADYDSLPLPEIKSFNVKKSQKSLKELFGGEIGILAAVSYGGNFTSKGDYGTPVQLAFLFDGENLIGRLPEIQFSSNVFDMYGSAFRGVSKDTFLPFCSERFAVMDLMASK